MTLDPLTLQKTQAWLQAKCRGVGCPCCGNNAWTVGDICTTLPVQGGVVQLGGTTIPTVPIACTNCGYMRFFSAVIMGLLPRSGASGNAPAPPGEEPPRTS